VSRWLPTTAGSWAEAEGFVPQLRTWLEAAQEVDRTYPQNGQVVISRERGTGTKRIVRQPDPPSLEA